MVSVPTETLRVVYALGKQKSDFCLSNSALKSTLYIFVSKMDHFMNGISLELHYTQSFCDFES